VSYWINLVLLGAVLSIATFSIPTDLLSYLVFPDDSVLSSLDRGLRLSAVMLLGVMMLFGSIGLTAWQMVGVWRSANRHSIDSGRVFWATVAKMLIIVGLIGNLFIWITQWQGVEAIWKQARNILPEILEDQSPQIIVSTNGRVATLAGTITFGSAYKLKETLDANPNIEVLNLNSIGGRIREGRAMAKLVRDRGLSTYSSEYCISACTTIFVAGKARILYRNANLGFHSVDLALHSRTEAKAETDKEAQVFIDAGVDEDFIRRAQGVPTTDVWYPTIDELRHANMIHGTSDGAEFPEVEH